MPNDFRSLRCKQHEEEDAASRRQGEHDAQLRETEDAAIRKQAEDDAKLQEDVARWQEEEAKRLESKWQEDEANWQQEEELNWQQAEALWRETHEGDDWFADAPWRQKRAGRVDHRKATPCKFYVEASASLPWS